MAPALTQATEPHPEAARISPPLRPYAAVKQVLRIPSYDKPYVNGGTLAPSTRGGPKCRPIKPVTPVTTMDQLPCLPTTNKSDTITSDSSYVPITDDNMGCHTVQQSHFDNLQTSNTNKMVKSSTTPQQDGDIVPPVSTSTGELMSLIGKDFDNVNLIIFDTLQKIASNPELLNIENADLDPSSHSSGSNKPCTCVPNIGPEEKALSSIEELTDLQRKLERRRIHLLRRLKRVSARGLGATVSVQLRHLLNHARSVLAGQKAVAKALSPTNKINNSDSLKPDIGAYHDTMKGMSTSALVSLVKRVENNQHNKVNNTSISTLPPCLPPDSRLELETVACEMQAAAKNHLHHDSDATESSSGEESCDETADYSDTATQFVPIGQRSLYRYYRTRGWVASRWTWLQAQIADLEYKILQQQKIYTHIRNNKGTVQVEEPTAVPKMRTLIDPAYMDARDPALTCLTPPTSSRTVNGYHPTNKLEDSSSPHNHELGGCARTLGLKYSKKRKLIRATLSGRRANGVNKAGGVRCRCILPLTCISCAGSSSNLYVNNHTNNSNKANHHVNNQHLTTYMLDPVSHPTCERIAKVDPAYHPVLSQPKGLLQSEVYDCVMKCTEWQKNTMSKLHKNPCPVNKSKECLLPHVDSKKRKEKEKDNDWEYNKEIKKHKKDKKGKNSLKLKRALLCRSISKDGDAKQTTKLNSFHEKLVSGKRNKGVVDSEDESGLLSSSLNSSPSVSPAPIDRSALHRHKHQPTSQTHNNNNPAQKNKQINNFSNSYDIDNIVIPYSMAAATRVEKLEYKEIPTPKWRIVPLIAETKPDSDIEFEDDEDVSEEAVAARHARSEELERKKFQQYYTHGTSRSMRTRRTDSSGTNTPDHPLSPRLQETPIDTLSPMATPPHTPLAPSEDSNHSSITLPQTVQIPLPKLVEPQNVVVAGPSFIPTVLEDKEVIPSIAAACRRTRSSSSSSRFRSSSISWEDSLFDKKIVAPFDLRNFPLNNKDYDTMIRESNCDNSTVGIAYSPLKSFLPLPTQSRSPPFLNEATEQSVPNSGKYTNRNLISSGNGPLSMASGSETQSGRSSPLSEITDSAPEEDETQVDDLQPEWTISGIKDDNGHCVLQVQRH